MSNTKHLGNADFNGHPLLQQNFEEIKKGRGVTKLIGELDKAGKNVKTANGWVPVKGNEHLVNDGNKKENKNAEIQDVRKLIKEQIGLDLKVADEERIKKLHGRKYFNAFLNERVSESKEFDLLKNFADKYKIIDIEPNGFKQIAIFFNDKENYTKTLTNADVNVHPDIKEAIDNYKGGTIPSEVLIHLATKYASKQPTEVFDSVHGAKIRVYGKEGNNYAINFGGAKGIALATEADMNTMRGIKKSSLKEKVIQILGDISANNRREKRLIQANIDAVYDNFERKQDYAAALRLIYDFEANDRGKSVKREALNSIANEIEDFIGKKEDQTFT